MTETVKVPKDLLEDLLGLAQSHLRRLEHMRGSAAGSGRSMTRVIVERTEELLGKPVE